MWKRFTELFLPFVVIARELTTIRELYELELSSRHPPIMRITEKPRSDDTEITFAGDPVKKTKKEQLRSLFKGEDDEREDDYEDSDNEDES